jgi:hypothetical protein
VAVPTVTANSPVAGSIAWGAFNIQYLGTSYAIGAGNTANRWVWWRWNGGGANSVIEAGQDIPTGDLENQLLNADFELPDDSDATLPKSWVRPTTGGLWYNAAHTATLSTAQIYSGVQSLALTTLATGTTGPNIMQPVVLTPGSTVRVTLRARSTFTGTGMYVMLANSAGTAEIIRFTGISGNVTTSPAWQVYSATLVVPAGATAGRLMILSYNKAVNDVLYIEDVEFGVVNPTTGLTDDDLVLLGNKNGIPFRVQSSSFLDGDLLIDGSVAMKALAAEVIVASDIYGNDGYFGGIKADQLETGVMNAVMAVVGGGGLTVGDGVSITEANGIEVIHQDSAPGVERIATTLKKAGTSLRAEVTADVLTILGNFSMRGTSNQVATGAQLSLQAGSTPPVSGPQLSSDYPQHYVHKGFNGRGLARFTAEDGQTYLETESLYGSTITKLYKETVDGTYADRGDGLPSKIGDYCFAYASFTMTDQRPEITSGLGGITVLGTEVYTLCETSEGYPGTYRGRWYVYQWHWNGSGTPVAGRFTFVRRWLYENTVSGAASTKYPAIGNDGTNILVMQANKNSNWNIYKYGPTGNYIGAVNPTQSGGTTYMVALWHAAGIVYSPADLGGAACYWLAFQEYPWVYCFNATTGVRITANEFPAPIKGMYSLDWDGTRFITRGEQTVFDFSQVKDTDLATNAVKGVQTWRLNDNADTATTVVGDYATYETMASPPSSSVALSKRAWVRVSSKMPIPDDPGDANDPDSLSFYLARGANPANIDYHRIPPYHTTADKGTTSILLDVLPTVGLPPPATTTWGQQTPSKILPAPTATDGNGALWQLVGDGSGRAGPLRWNSSGAMVSRIPVLLGMGRINSSIATTASQFNAGSVNNVTVRPGFTYTCRWRGNLANTVAGNYSYVQFKYGAGAVTGGNIIGSGYFVQGSVGNRVTLYSDSASFDYTGAEQVVNFVVAIVAQAGTTQLYVPAVDYGALLEVYETPT